jgi:group I intron endonuclease
MAKIICGIYYIKNNINNKMYIGLSIDVEARIRRHMKDLKVGVHPNVYLQRAWTKYGNENFEFGILEECDKSKLADKEICWIAYYDSYNSGYNSTIGGYGTKSINEEGKIKKALSREGKKLPEYMIIKKLKILLYNLRSHCLSTYGLSFEDFKIKDNKTKKQLRDLMG